MTTLLPKEDKIQLIEVRIKGLEYKQFGLQMDLLIENAKDVPDSESIAKINEAIEEIDNQVVVLNAELTSVNALTE